MTMPLPTKPADPYSIFSFFLLPPSTKRRRGRSDNNLREVCTFHIQRLSNLSYRRRKPNNRRMSDCQTILKMQKTGRGNILESSVCLNFEHTSEVDELKWLQITIWWTKSKTDWQYIASFNHLRKNHKVLGCWILDIFDHYVLFHPYIGYPIPSTCTTTVLHPSLTCYSSTFLIRKLNFPQFMLQ